MTVSQDVPASMADRDLRVPDGFTVANATPADLQAVFDLIHAADLADYGEPDLALDDLASEWADMDVHDDVFLVRADNGTVVGYVAIDARTPVRVIGDGYVHPDWQGRGVGRALIRLSERRARDLIDRAPPEARVTLGHGTNAASPAATELMVSEGLVPVRYFWRMEATLDQGAPAEPVTWPDGITVIACATTGEAGQPGPAVWAHPNGTLTGDRAAAVIADQRRAFIAIDEAFEDHWGHLTQTFEEWLAIKGVDCPDPSLWFLALDGDDVAGGVIGTWYNGQGWVKDLGVRKPWRNRGLGDALLRHIMREFGQRGATTVALGVDAANSTGATRLYERAGMRRVREFCVFEKELRPGTAADDASERTAT